MDVYLEKWKDVQLPVNQIHFMSCDINQINSTVRTFLFSQIHINAQCGLYYYDKKGVISGQYYSLSKKLAKIGYFDKSGFESSIAEKISLPEIWLVFEKISL